MSHWKRCLVVCAALALPGALITTVSAPAVAQQADAKAKAAAKKAYGVGKQKLAAKDYEGALESFREADQSFPGAAPKHKIAVCLDKLGRIKEAIESYQAFLDSNPSKKYAARVEESKKRLEELRTELAAMPGTVALVVEPTDATGLAITVDGDPAEAGDIELPAGEHTIVVNAEGMETATETVQVEPAERHELTITLSAPAAPPPPPDEEPEDGDGSDGLLIGGIIGAGLAVAGGAVGGIFGVMALGAQSDFDATPTEELADDAETYAKVADAGFIVGGIGLVAAVILIPVALSGDEGDEEEGGDELARPELLPYAGPEGAGMAATWRF